MSSNNLGETIKKVLSDERDVREANCVASDESFHTNATKKHRLHGGNFAIFWQ